MKNYYKRKKFFAMMLVLALGMNVAWSGTVSYAEEDYDDEEQVELKDSQGLYYSGYKVGSKLYVTVTEEEKNTVSGKIIIPATIKDEKTGKSYKVVMDEVTRGAFGGCKKITDVTLPATWDSIDDIAFTDCSKLQSVTIKAKSVKEIGWFAFAECKKLIKIKNIEKVQRIDYGAFYKCIALKKLNLSSVTYIGDSAFEGCKNLSSITIGKNFTEFAMKAFYGCKKLKTIVIKSTKVKKVDKNAFSGTSPKITIKVPKKKLKAYTKLFKNKGNKKVVVKAI